MAYTSQDGKKFTNRPPMMAHDRSMARQSGMSKPDPTAQPGMEAQHDPNEGGEQAHDPQELEQLKQSFDGVMQALATGQRPDPEMVKQLIDVFNSFITEEEHEEHGGDEPEYE